MLCRFNWSFRVFYKDLTFKITLSFNSSLSSTLPSLLLPLLVNWCGMSGSTNIRWHLGVYCKSLPQGHLLPSPSDCPSDSFNQGCAQPLKLQPPSDQILVIKSTDQLTAVELTVFSFMAPFEVNATLIIGQAPVSRIVIRVILIPLAVFLSHKSLFKLQACKNVCFVNNAWPQKNSFLLWKENADWINSSPTFLAVSHYSIFSPVSQDAPALMIIWNLYRSFSLSRLKICSMQKFP